MVSNIGVEYLIEVAKKTTQTSVRNDIEQQIAVAGGHLAQEYLVEQARHATASSDKMRLYKLIGQASRVN